MTSQTVSTANIVEIWMILVVAAPLILIQSNPRHIAYEHFVTNIRNFSDNLIFTLLNSR